MMNALSLRALRSLALVAAVASAGCYGGAGPELANEPDNVTAEDDAPATAVLAATSTSLNNNQAELCVTASSDNNSGTSETVNLDYVNERIWSCSITGGFSAGQTRCCTATSGVYNVAYTPFFYVGIPQDGTDGFQFTAVSYRSGSGSTHTVERWGTDTSVKSGGCTAGLFNCNNSWVDSDGNGGCHRAALRLWSDNVTCHSGNGYVVL